MALHVELVAVERKLWSGDARQVTARTTEGEIGVLTGHMSHLSVLVEGGIVEIQQDEGVVRAAVHGGFLLVDNNTVRILAESAELGDEIDVERARADLGRAEGSDDDESRRTELRARARLRAAGEPA